MSDRQRELLDTWLPDAHVVANHSWGLVQTTVVEVYAGGARLIVKAGGPQDHHIERELRAHREWLAPWVRTGHAPQLVHGDVEAKLLVTRYLPGTLVQGHPAQDDPETYRQAGALLATFHAQSSTVDDTWERRNRERLLSDLDGPHRIDPVSTQRLRAEVSSWPDAPATLVPTHGDWQPRNWLIDGEIVRVIDFGRAELRPAVTDFARLERQDFARDPALEAAFIEGYGIDPRSPDLWRRTMVTEAIGTAVWAYGVGDEDFEQHGHRMIAALLDEPLAQNAQLGDPRP
ncbi:phosphotransferase [Calidifontibacter sp. DB0510]|uniref:Phosphotransferase n=1 Tax=Metallococcus carri TaxID=1656884 RepID=A0A967B4V4_9MICO|nr:phosphotransferase [Metallococcus carri]NOP38085.1 phosphotransferase [Calidifontibacter sp. DB2511S]